MLYLSCIDVVVRDLILIVYQMFMRPYDIYNRFIICITMIIYYMTETLHSGNFGDIFICASSYRHADSRRDVTYFFNRHISADVLARL